MLPAERRPQGDPEVRVAVVQVDAPQQRLARQLPSGQLDRGEHDHLAIRRGSPAPGRASRRSRALPAARGGRRPHPRLDVVQEFGLEDLDVTVLRARSPISSPRSIRRSYPARAGMATGAAALRPGRPVVAQPGPRRGRRPAGVASRYDGLIRPQVSLLGHRRQGADRHVSLPESARHTHAKANKALDAAEKPDEMLDLSYEQMLDHITKVRQALVTIAASRKQIELQERSSSIRWTTCRIRPRPRCRLARRTWPGRRCPARPPPRPRSTAWSRSTSSSPRKSRSSSRRCRPCSSGSTSSGRRRRR